VSAFKAYIGSNTYSGLKRTTNLFICSIYKHNGVDYFGITGNFFELKKPQVQISDNEKQRIIDSANMSDSSRMKPDSSRKAVNRVDTDEYGIPIRRHKITKNNADPLGILPKKKY
jgi:hypothetical protein